VELMGSAIEKKEGGYMDLGVRGPSGEVVDGKKRRGRDRLYGSLIGLLEGHMVSKKNRCDGL